MTNYPLNRTYSETIRQLETTDKVHADTFNPLFNQIINNAAAHNDRLDGHDASLADMTTDVKFPPAPLVAAKGDGTTDDTNALKAILNSITNGGKILFPTGTYVISSSLPIPSNVEIIGSSNSIIFLKAQSDISMLVLDGVQNVTIRNLTIDGNRTNQINSETNQSNLAENHHGIDLFNSQNITISNNVIRNCSGDGVGVNGHFNITSSSNLNLNIKIEKNDISLCGRNGISVIHAEGVSIENNHIHGQQAYVSSLGCGIDIEPNTGQGSEQWIIRNIHLTNNRIFNNNEGIQVVGGGNSNQIIQRILIENNFVYQNLHHGLQVINVGLSSSPNATYENINIHHNLINENGFSGGSSLDNYVGLILSSVLIRVNVKNNVISKSQSLIEVTDCQNVNVSDNHLNGWANANGGDGITIYNTSNSFFRNNTIAEPLAGGSFVNGINFTSLQSTQNSKNNLIEGNSIVDSVGGRINFGVQILSNNASWTGILTGNIISNNFFNGLNNSPIRFTNSLSTDNTVEVNVINGIIKLFNYSDNSFTNYNTGIEAVYPTASRPTTNAKVGQRIFDSTLNKPIWFKGGGVWIDATGTTV